MASDPGAFKGSAGQLDANKFFEFPLEIRQRVYSYLYEEPVEIEWAVGPRREWDVALKVHNSPCTSLLQIGRFKEDYEESLSLTVTARFTYFDCECTVPPRYGPGDSDDSDEEIEPKEQHRGETTFISLICKRLRHLTIYGHPCEELTTWYADPYFGLDHLFASNEFNNHNPLALYQAAEDFIAIVFHYSHSKDHSQHLRSLPHRATVFGVEVPVYPDADMNKERFSLLHPALKVVNIGLVYEMCRSEEKTTPTTDNSNTFIPVPANIAGLPLVQQGHGITIQRGGCHVAGWGPYREVDLCGWKMIALSYSSQGHFRLQNTLTINEVNADFHHQHEMFDNGRVFSGHWRVDEYGDNWTMDEHGNKTEKV